MYFRVKNSQLKTHEKLCFTPDTLTLGASLSREDPRVDYAGYFSAYFVILCTLEALLSIVTLRAVFSRQRGRQNFTEGAFEAVLQIAIRHH